ncbi:DUF4411 family protein [bacterium]|nr:DUF4411 family protein [bacterium]
MKTNCEKFCLDTSFIIDAWYTYYPKDIFRCFWNRLDSFIRNQKILIPRTIWIEIFSGINEETELKKWFRKLEKYIIEAHLNKDITDFFEKNVKYFYESSNGQKLNFNDGQIIAFSKIYKLTLVTAEKQRDGKKVDEMSKSEIDNMINQIKKPNRTAFKIPDVCSSKGIDVKWCAFGEFVKKINGQESLCGFEYKPSTESNLFTT